jgi:hypothetical protein
MKLLAQILTLYNWGAVCVLLFFLFGIARFFEKRLIEKNSNRPKKQFYYPFFLAPVILYGVSALIYAFGETLIVGNFIADLIRIAASLTFAYVGYLLLKTMTGGRT